MSGFVFFFKNLLGVALVLGPSIGWSFVLMFSAHTGLAFVLGVKNQLGLAFVSESSISLLKLG